MDEFVYLIVLISSIAFSYVLGVNYTFDKTQQKCVAMYSDMPYNKVNAHCKELLQFKKV